MQKILPNFARCCKYGKSVQQVFIAYFLERLTWNLVCTYSWRIQTLLHCQNLIPLYQFFSILLNFREICSNWQNFTMSYKVTDRFNTPRAKHANTRMNNNPSVVPRTHICVWRFENPKNLYLNVHLLSILYSCFLWYFAPLL